MELFLTLGLPVIIIVGLLRVLKVKWPKAFWAVVVLAAISTFIVDYTYCEILKKQCEPDALNAVGYLFHWIMVSVFTSVLDIVLVNLFTKKEDVTTN